ncbi:MAG: amidohydrolase family protein [Sphingomonadaceae bacterium]|nr:amidohydrolase family protein [Sphingomonadaceae bacterium]
MWVGGVAPGARAIGLRRWIPAFAGITRLAGAALIAAPLAAAPIAITNANVMTGAGTTIEGATVVVDGGRIRSVGSGPAPAGATVIDGTGRTVTPGLVVGMSDLGLDEIEGVGQANDTAAKKSPFSASLDVVPALNPRDSEIAVARTSGVTRAVVAPSAARDIFAGQGALIRLADGQDIVTRGRAFQLVELGEAGAENAGGSRTASFALFRNALAEAQRFASGRGREGNRENIYPRADTEALVPVVEGRQPLVVHAERASDILSVLALKADFPRLRLVLFGAREGWTVADRIAAAHVPVITSAIDDLPDAFETLASTRSNVGRMLAAGVVVGLGTSGGESTNQPRNVTQFAGNLVAQGRLPSGVGVTRDQALSLITKNPAEIFGMADTGVIAPGKRADLVVWDGDPLEVTSAPVAVLIDGVPQPLANRQTELRDRYRDLRHDTLPLEYRP